MRLMAERELELEAGVRTDGVRIEEELRDMRHWANQAKTEDFALVPR